MNRDNKLVKIGIFYDGNYFLHVSNYYAYSHERKSRLSVSGLHTYLKHLIAQFDGSDDKYCQIVDAHYFRGRLSASEAANQGNTLFYDRLFDDILSSEGITTHYLPVRTTPDGIRHEKGIDVWLALEAYELAFYKKFDILVLVASDGDYVSLIRKLNTLGTRVMVLGWDFEYTNDNGKVVTTRTSQELLEEVTYPVSMHEIIDNRLKKNDPLINNLFVPKILEKVSTKQRINQPIIDEIKIQTNLSNGISTLLHEELKESKSGKKVSTIKSIKEGFGFINGKTKDIFFFHAHLVDYDFNDLEIGDKVEYFEEVLEDGRLVGKEVIVLE